MSRAELFRALGTLAEPTAAGHAAIAAALGLPGAPGPGDHADVFLFGAYPYASVYLGAEGMLGGEARDRVAGFWRAFGLTPPPEPDHLAALLGMYAGLVDAEDAAARDGDATRGGTHRAARRAFLWEHLLAWLPPYLDTVAELASPTFAAWARLLGEALVVEAEEVGRIDRLPLHLRAAPGLPEAGAAADEWVGALLAPVRSGILLTRWGLRRAAAELGMGARMGERAFMLRSLLEQDAAASGRWLADEARRAARRHAALPAGLGPVRTFWRDRAEATVAAIEGALDRGAEVGGRAMAGVAAAGPG